MNRFVCAFLLLGFFAGCDDQDLLEENVYEQVALELIILNQIDENVLSPEEKEELRNQIFDHYDTTEEQFRNTHSYFQQDAVEQMERMEKLGIELRNKRDHIQEAEREFSRSTQISPDSLRKRLLNSDQ